MNLKTVRELNARQVAVSLTPEGNVRWDSPNPLPDDVRALIVENKARIIWELTPCIELGRPLRDDEVKKYGVNPEECGCHNRLRQCGYHDKPCTTMVILKDFYCCEMCEFKV